MPCPVLNNRFDIYSMVSSWGIPESTYRDIDVADESTYPMSTLEVISKSRLRDFGMLIARRVIYSLIVSSLLAALASSQAPDYSWVCGLQTLAGALGWVMMVIMGLKWIVAESPNERAEAKKGMLYIVIGLLIVASMRNLLQSLYCDTITKAGFGGFTCTLPPPCT